MKSMESNNRNTHSIKPQEEFLRNVIFLKDEDKVLAVFPFYHEISEVEYESVIENFYDTDFIPPKHDFCLMNEVEFGWGWINKQMITHLDIADEEDYQDFKNLLLGSRVIKEHFILNEA